MHPPLSMTASPADRPGPGGDLAATDATLLLTYARMLQSETLAGNPQPWLRGKYIALVDTDRDSAQGELLERAATELGAKVAQVRPFHDGAPASSAESSTSRG